MLMRSSDGVAPRYLDINVSAGNRAGKTLMLAIGIFHSTLFKLGMPSPSALNERQLESWLTATYEWYHFAIQQETSELVYYELVRILSGTHEAQKGKGCPLLEEVGQVAEWTRKYRGEYLWMVVHPVFGGGQLHFRTTAEKAIGSLGKDMSGISYDECGFDPNLTFIVNEVLQFRRLSTGGQLILISTPTEGLTDFADRWYEADPDVPDHKPDAISMRMSTRDNIGYGIDQTMFDRLVAGLPPYLVPQNVDGEFIEGAHAFFGGIQVGDAFIDTLPEETLPLKGHRYMQGVDPALTFDSTWAIVLDITDRKHMTGVKAARRQGRQTVLAVAAVATEGHMMFSSNGATCVTALDSTGFGGAAIRDQLGALKPLRAVEFGGVASKKVKLLTELKGVIERGELKLPKTGLWLQLRRQLSGYIIKNDRKLETDAVMALAVAVHEALRMGSGPYAQSVPFEMFGDNRTGSTERVVSQPSPAGRIVTIDDYYARERD